MTPIPTSSRPTAVPTCPDATRAEGDAREATNSGRR